MNKMREEIKEILYQAWQTTGSVFFYEMHAGKVVDEILAKIVLELPKEKEFLPTAFDDAIIMNECTDETFSIEKAEGWNDCLTALKHLLSEEK